MHEPHWCRHCTALIPSSALVHRADDHEYHSVQPAIAIPTRRLVGVQIVKATEWTKMPAAAGRFEWVPPGVYVVAFGHGNERLVLLRVRQVADDLDVDGLLSALADALGNHLATKEHTNA